MKTHALSSFRYHLSQLRIQWKGQHIKGQQDSNKSYEELDIVAQGNVDADKYAAIEMDLNRVVNTRTKIGAPWALEHEGTQISCNIIEKRIRHLVHEHQMQEYWRKKFNLTEEQQSNISWDTFLKTNKMNEEWAQIWMSKYNSRIGGVHMLQRNHSTDDQCPWCRGIEDIDHLLKCPKDEIQEIYEDNMVEIQKWLTKTTTPEIARGI